MKSRPDSTDLRASLSLSLGAAYIIDRELDAEGTARIFVAHEESADQDVAIVVLEQALTQGVSPDVFLTELGRAELLEEEHTLPVLAEGQTAEGLFYYTAPMVRGTSLRYRIEQGPLGFDESVGVLRDIARAMAYAHGRGFVHRNLSPEHILLAKHSAVVSGFGLARALERAGAENAQALLTHASYTSTAYIAPEQAAGELGGERVDIYAWGVMAYELLLDADPFADINTPAKGVAITVSDVSPLQLFKRHGVPEQLALLVMRCCELDPAARPSSAAELVQVLERIPDRASTLARERKHAARWIGASIVAALALFVASGVGVWRMQKRESYEIPLVAVLPFDTEGTSPDSLFADDLTESVRDKLARIGSVRVIDPHSVIVVRDSTHDLRGIGKALDANFVLHASITWARGADGQMHATVTPRVLRMSDSAQRWDGDPEVLSPGRPFAGVGTLAQRVLHAMGIVPDSMGKVLLAASATRDPVAFASFERAAQISSSDVLPSPMVFEQAMRDFEAAYRRDSTYAAALGGAALMLARLSEAGAQPSMYDSAMFLSRRARRQDPREYRAFDAAALVALADRRFDDAQLWLDRALTSNPSDLVALQRRGDLLAFMGDSAGAWRDVETLAAVAPRSASALAAASNTAQTLRRFPDALTYLQRARAVAPERNDLVLENARLARVRGNLESMTRSIREYRRRGGVIGPVDFVMLRVGDESMRHELATLSPARLGVVSPGDSVNYYVNKGDLLLAQHQQAAARALFDLAVAPLVHLSSAPAIGTSDRRHYRDLLAWANAARGDQKSALAAVNGVDRDTLALQWPHGELAANIACNSAEIYAFTDAVEEMIQQLRRCLTLPGGYAPNAISAEPAIWRHAIDPRLRALLGEFHLEVRRKE
ncbi:MAG: serine/threonine-protein kinase [Gemmatimonadota bacterium]|nr:serine/threonine-protein kinase [Gemmatimonadota bacterium]